MFGIDVLSRIVHVSTAIVLLGGSIFTWLVWQPAVRQRSVEDGRLLGDQIRRRWKPFVHGGILLFLVSGFYNYFRAAPRLIKDGLYHAGVPRLTLVIFLWPRHWLALGPFRLAADSGWLGLIISWAWRS